MEQLLKQFGFSAGEVIVYKSLLISGGAKVSEVARSTKLKRTTCQEYVQSLEKKGFINSSKLGNKYFYQAEDPDKFRQIINERQFIIGKLVPELRQLSDKQEWNIRSITAEEAGRDIRRAKRRNKKVLLFGSSSTGGAAIEDSVIVLFSTNKEIPAIEITSKAIYDFHKHLFVKVMSTDS